MKMEAQQGLDFSSPQCESSNGQSHDGSSLRMCPDYIAAKKGETLLPWLEKWLGANLTYREMDGKMPVVQSAKTDLSSGSLWMRNTAEHLSTLEPSHKDEGVSSLSEILETGKVESRYFLSRKACAGILRRAEKRGKKLPEQLHKALVANAEAVN